LINFETFEITSKTLKMKSIEKYIELIFPIIEYCAKESQKENFEKDHVWYLNRQAFYGFGMFFTKYYYSEKAKNKFLELHKEYLNDCAENNKTPIHLTIDSLDWNTQPLIDKGRINLIFEHMYTGTMFRNDIQKLHFDGKLTKEDIKKLVGNKYKVCLITKEENKSLHKTQRGSDPIAYYTEKKIKIVNI
jgi:hypothetical protein